ncbi:MAG: DUF6385 domain-containing protein [Alicyclobacillus herbarius]|uniref:DUF6385 domain-containing protein n=1 Tax=Alicyclobacillus herbarius TaxID=122960 RepID=UPI0023527C03|nr:DUF6385 domain-containing protein [Alicyclobacillus herbarius]MCL6633463.1 DUF6385 domain-containing protein [Alicyclobacillus herbarius]
MATKVFSEVASSFLTQVFQTTASNLRTQVFQSAQSNLRARVFQSAHSLLQAGVFQSAQSNLRARVFQSLASLLRVTFVQSIASTAPYVQLGGRATVSTASTRVVSSTATYGFGFTQNVLQLSAFTFTVQNAGATGNINAKIQLSADATNWYDDPGSTVQTLTAGKIFTFTPGRFTKYARIASKKADAAGSTLLTFAQGHV